MSRVDEKKSKKTTYAVDETQGAVVGEHGREVHLVRDTDGAGNLHGAVENASEDVGDDDL